MGPHFPRGGIFVKRLHYGSFFTWRDTAGGMEPAHVSMKKLLTFFLK
jgi:hypothetical protein